jgi:hypothetical protein
LKAIEQERIEFRKARRKDSYFSIGVALNTQYAFSLRLTACASWKPLS